MSKIYKSIDPLRGLKAAAMAIDLGTANTRVYIEGRGIVLDEPSVVAVQTHEGLRRVVAVGEDVAPMVNLAPGSVQAIRPLRHTIIDDFDVADEMIRHFIRKVRTGRSVGSPEIIVCGPVLLASVNRRAIQASVEAAGASRVFVIEEPVAAAIGAGVNLTGPTSALIVEIGASMTHVAVLASGGIVRCRSIRVGGDRMDEAIIACLRRTHDLLVDAATAERIKREIGSACLPAGGEGRILRIEGRDPANSAPRAAIISEREIAESLAEPVGAIVEAVKAVLEHTAPDRTAGMVDQGIVLSGGGALLGTLDVALRHATGLPVTIAADPLNCVARGAGRALADQALRQAVVSAASERASAEP